MSTYVVPWLWSDYLMAERPSPVVESLGQKIRSMREAAGINREVFAVRAGLSSRTVIRVELGHHQPSLRTLRCIAEALGVSVAELLNGDVGEAA